MDGDIEDEVIQRWGKPDEGTVEAAGDEQQSAVKPEARTSRGDGTISDRLLEIAEATRLFHDQRGDGYAVVSDKGVRKTLKLQGKPFRSWLTGQFWARERRAASPDAIRAAIGALEARATHEGQCIPLSVRFARHAECIYIDLADDAWRAVKITRSGWEVVSEPPILFRRYEHQLPLPAPERGGRLDEVHGFLNIASHADRELTNAWLVTAVFADVPRPIMTIHGAQGSGKTVAARVLRSLLDPSGADALAFSRSAEELAQILDHHAIPTFDNLRTIDAQGADMLCRATTGGAISKRELYTNGDDVIFTFKRAMIVNGINIPTHAADLLDRMLLVELERIPENKRRTEREFWAAFHDARPRLLGALYEAVSAVLRTQVEVRDLPRLADFGELAAQWYKGTGRDPEEILRLYRANVTRQVEEAIESDSVGTEIQAFVGEHTYWVGTPTQLLIQLNERRGTSRAPEDWPRMANSLSKRLRTLQTPLLGIGIQVQFSKSGKRRVTLRKLSSEPSNPPNPETSAGSGLDGSDRGRSLTAPIDRPAGQQPSPAQANSARPVDGMDGLGGRSGLLEEVEVEA